MVFQNKMHSGRSRKNVPYHRDFKTHIYISENDVKIIKIALCRLVLREYFTSYQIPYWYQMCMTLS